MRDSAGQRYSISAAHSRWWVNLDQIVQMTTIGVQDGYPSTEIIMANGTAINVYEKPVDIANLTKAP
jgi:hypothetical protein